MYISIISVVKNKKKWDNLFNNAIEKGQKEIAIIEDDFFSSTKTEVLGMTNFASVSILLVDIFTVTLFIVSSQRVGARQLGQQLGCSDYSQSELPHPYATSHN